MGVSQSSAQSETSTGGNRIDMNGFLNLFLTQLENQDPTNPLESYELAAQLAQFSTVEQLSQVNANILKQKDYLTSINYGQMAQLIGRDVVAVDDSIQLTDGETSKSSYELNVSAEVSLKILDDRGTLIRTISLGNQESGTYEVEWDGKNDSGEVVPDGTYHVQVEAVDADGNFTEATQTVSGKIYALSLDQDNPQFIIGGPNGVKVSAGTISEVREMDGSGTV